MLIRRISVVILFMVVGVFQPAAGAENYLSTPITLCITSSSQNCVEQLIATFPDGAKATAVPTGKTSVANCSNVNGITTPCNFFEWRVEGLRNEDGRNLVQTIGWIQPPNAPSNTTLPPGGLLFFISNSGWDSQVRYISTGICANNNPLNLDCRGGYDLQSGVSWTVSIRAGKFEPAWTTGTLKNSLVTFSRSANGNMLTYTGEPNLTAGIISNPNSDGTPPERNDYESLLWSIRSIDSSDPVAASVKNQRCGGLNPIMMTDALWVGLPTFNSEDASIQLSVRNPHYLSNGKESTGQFEGEFSEDFVSCFWKKSLSDASGRVQLELTYGTGEKAVATLVSGISNGKLKISAAGYHYSSPVIKISLKKETSSSPMPKTSASKPVKPQLITCVKGKVTKKVSTTKCPAGYKKK